MKLVNKRVAVVILTISLIGCAVLLAYGLAVHMGCGGSDGGGATNTISTDATVNENLLTSFTGPNSVTLSGTWHNNYYGTEGSILANVVFNSTTKIMTLDLDVGGMVYGQPDPGSQQFTFDMTDFINNGTATLTANSNVYGDVVGTLTFYDDDTGVFSGTAANEPTGQVTNAIFSGTFEISGSTVSFTINNASFDFNGIPITCTDTITTTIN